MTKSTPESRRLYYSKYPEYYQIRIWAPVHIPKTKIAYKPPKRKSIIEPIPYMKQIGGGSNKHEGQNYRKTYRK